MTKRRITPAEAQYNETRTNVLKRVDAEYVEIGRAHV